jgi:hypothetical protein
MKEKEKIPWKGGGGGDNIFQTIIEFVIFFPQFFITMQNLARQKDYHISYVKWNNIQY